MAQELGRYYSCLKMYRRAYSLATQNIPTDWSLFTASSSRYASLCKVLSRIPLWYCTCPFLFRGVLAFSVIKFAILRSRREVSWLGCRQLRLPIPFLLFCLSPASSGLSDSLKQPFLTWGPRTTWASVNLDRDKNYNFLFTNHLLKFSFSFSNSNLWLLDSKPFLNINKFHYLKLLQPKKGKPE